MVEYSIEAKKFQFEFILHKGVNWPKLFLNCKSTSETLIINESTKKVNYFVDSEPDKLVFTYLNKTSADTSQTFDQCVILQNLYINNIKIDLNIIKEGIVLYPKFSKEYVIQCNNQNIDLPTKVFTNEFYFNGQIVLEYKKPFFEWYHQLQLQSINEANFYVKNNIFGIVDEMNLNRLKNIFISLNK